MVIYHFSGSIIEKFKHTKPLKSYSMASGIGIYFTTNYEKGLLKYGKKNEFCYRCKFSGKSILNLGEFDSMYFNGSKIHSSFLVSENFKRKMNGMKEIREPDICIENISKKAYDWLIKKNIQAVMGMDYWGYACPEFCVIDESCIEILDMHSI